MNRVIAALLMLMAMHPALAEEKVAARLHAVFARLPSFKPPVEDLEFFADAPLDSSSRLTTQYQRRFQSNRSAVEQRRTALDRASRAYLMAAVNFLRADAGWANLGKKLAESNLNQRQLAWLGELVRLQKEEARFRKTAEDYYVKVYANRFAGMSEPARKKTLAYFGKRLVRLRKLRRLTFEVIEDQRERFFEHLTSKALKEYRGRMTATDRANATLGNVAMMREYAWLVSENTLACTIFARLLQQEETVVRSGSKPRRNSPSLHSMVVAAFARDAALRPDGPLPNDADAVRLEMVRLRAQRARTLLMRDEIMLEAAYRNKVSLLLGMRKALTDAGKRAGATWEMLTETEGASARGLTYGGLSVATTAYKFFGDSFTATVGTHTEDAITDFALKPLFKLFGGEAKNTVQRQREQHKEQFELLARRLGMMKNIAERYSVGQCRQFIDYFLKDHAANGTAAAPVPQNLRQTTQALLSDEAFIAANQGGLPGIFLPLCVDPKRYAGVCYRAAQYELGAALKSAGERVATARGLAVDPKTFSMNRKMLEKIYLPKNPQTGEPWPITQTDQLIYTVPFLGGVKALWDLRRNMARTFQLAGGLVPDQDKHLERLLDMRDRMRVYMLAFANAGFDSYKLQVISWDAYQHRAYLLRYAHPFIEAWRRVSAEQGERRKAFYWARHLDRGGKLSVAGQAMIASLQKTQDMEITSLATHAAYRKLQHLSLSLNYLGAEAQVKSISELETRRRAAWSITPQTVDLTQVEKGYRTEAHIAEVATIFQELAHSVVKEIVISAVSAGLANVVMRGGGRVAAEVAEEAAETAAAVTSPWKVAGKQLWGTLNPWAGKFQASGAFKFMVGKTKDSFKVNIAEIVAKKQNLLTAQDVEGAIDFVWDVTEDLRGESTTYLMNRSSAWIAARREHKQRQAIIDETGAWVRSYADATLKPLARQVKAEADPQKRADLTQRLRDARSDANFLMQRARLRAAKGDLEGAELRRSAAFRSAGRVADVLANEMAYVHSLKRQRAKNFDDEDSVRQFAEEFATTDFRRRLVEGAVTYPELMRLTNESDPLKLAGRLLQKGLDVDVVRRAITAARHNDPNNEGNIATFSAAVDKLRARKTQELVAAFVAEQEGVRRVVRDGPGEDDPEYGGLFDDMGLRFHLEPGANKAQVEAAFREFCKKRGLPVGEAGSLIANLEMVPYHRRPEGGVAREHPDEAPRWGYDRDLPEDGEATHALTHETAVEMTRVNGFRGDHARAMHKAAQTHRFFLIVRNGNPDSVDWFHSKDAVPKPMSSKAKTQRVGPHKGLVVNPLHDVQAAHWQKAIDEATGAHKTALEESRQTAVKTWNKYGGGMLSSGEFKVDDQGRVLVKVGPRQWKLIHGDYDLHGAFRLNDDGGVTRVDFGGGQPIHNRLRARFIRQLNRLIGDPLEKNFVQHGAQDNWISWQKSADPPVTVFFPDGREPLLIQDAAALRRFYEHEMRVKWEYQDARAPAIEAPPVPRDTRRIEFGGEVFLSAAAADWAQNFERARHKTIHGAADPESPRTLTRDDAPALALDMARQLGFLNDPQYTADGIAKLTPGEQVARLEALRTEMPKFLRLVDAYALGQPDGAALYKSRVERGTGYFGALYGHVETLGAMSGEDLGDLKRIVDMQRRSENADPWNVVGGTGPAGVRGMLELRDFMRRKTADMLAATGEIWAEQHTALVGTGTPGEKLKATETLRHAARIALASESGEEIGTTCMLVPPLAVGATDVRKIPRDVHRTAILREMDAAFQARQLAAKKLADARRQIEEETKDAEFDEALLKALEERIDALVTAARLPADTEAAARRQVWIEYLRRMGEG